jgi:hypothetical protein
VVDELEDHGAPPLTSATVVDVTDVVETRWGPVIGDQVRALGTVVNDTLFDPVGDGSAAAGAWPLADAIVAAVRAAPPIVPPPTIDPAAAPVPAPG